MHFLAHADAQHIKVSQSHLDSCHPELLLEMAHITMAKALLAQELEPSISYARNIINNYWSSIEEARELINLSHHRSVTIPLFAYQERAQSADSSICKWYSHSLHLPRLDPLHSHAFLNNPMIGGLVDPMWK